METLIAILIPILIEIESGGNPIAVGDGGNAVGILQIWEPYWKDGTEYLGVDWPAADRKSPVKSICVTAAYLTRYGKHYEKVTGKKATIEVLAALHCAGPDGWKQVKEKKVAAYLDKVRSLYHDK